jgi:hypothetical protein
VTNDQGTRVVVQAWARDLSRPAQLWYPQIAPIVGKAERYVYIKDDKLSPSLERRIKLQTQYLVNNITSDPLVKLKVLTQHFGNCNTTENSDSFGSFRVAANRNIL